jgi:arylsulfatase
MHRLPEWQELSDKQKKIEARRMEIYAAMVDNLDQHVGRLIRYLEDRDQLDNTFIVFMSDNGADGGDPHGIAGNVRWIPQNFDNSLANMGHRGSFVHYGPQWGQVSSTPFSHYKTSTREGGIKAPAFIYYPPLFQKGRTNHAVFSVLDIVPTLLELTELQHPVDQNEDHSLLPLQGHSMLGALREGHSNEERLFGWELFGRKAVRYGRWKLVEQDPPYGAGTWQLYDLINDSTEKRDLANSNPEILAMMKDYWAAYERQNGLVYEKIRVPYLMRTCVFEYCM